MSFIKGKGNYRMSHSFGWIGGRNIGVLNISLGTKDRKEAVRIEGAIVALKELDRGDLLHELKMGTRKPAELYRMVIGQKAGAIKLIENGENASDAIADWLPKARRANGALIDGSTRKSYENVLKVMLDKCATSTSTVADLPSILKCYQATCLDATPQKNRTFNKARAGCFAFARGIQARGRDSDLYRAMALVSAASNKRQKERVGLMVWEVREILSRLPIRWRDLAWFQVCSGARPKEMHGRITILADRILISGTKTAGAVRVVPKISDFKRTFINADYKPYNSALKKASGDRITCYDLRGTYRLWLTDAGVDRHRARRYCGWSAEDHDPVGLVEHGYTSTDVDNYLRQDTALLVKYLERNWEKPKADTAPLAKFIPSF